MLKKHLFGTSQVLLLVFQAPKRLLNSTESWWRGAQKNGRLCIETNIESSLSHLKSKNRVLNPKKVNKNISRVHQIWAVALKSSNSYLNKRLNTTPCQKMLLSPTVKIQSQIYHRSSSKRLQVTSHRFPTTRLMQLPTTDLKSPKKVETEKRMTKEDQWSSTRMKKRKRGEREKDHSQPNRRFSRKRHKVSIHF